MAMWRAWIAMVLGGLCCQAQVKLTLQDARKNLIGEVPAIRVPESTRHTLESVQLTIIVGKDGRVRSAEPKPSYYAPRALEIAKALQYRPFIRGGVLVEVEYDEYVRILPLERLPVTHVPFPNVSDLKTVEFWLKRSPCFGMCSVYEVHITGEGMVSYVGQPFDGLLGELRGRLSPTVIQSVLESFRKADFFSLDDHYSVMVTDFPTQTIGVRIGMASKTVVDYIGEEAGMPHAVTELEEQIDAVVGTVKGSGLAHPK